MLVEEKYTFKKPPKLSLKEGAGVLVIYYTLWKGLVERAKIKQGMTVLIHSAAGGVGLAAIQVRR